MKMATLNSGVNPTGVVGAVRTVADPIVVETVPDADTIIHRSNLAIYGSGIGRSVMDGPIHGGFPVFAHEVQALCSIA